ncbi:MAG: hypothetical protein J5I62_03260 [Flavobacteriales bacterium]|nr:hypothetical protein [Flavobacteriales bacterium]MEB2341120.1 hypothetical protein [Flavobacteriia bacterium]
MMKNGKPYQQYALMAELFRYPGEGLRDHVVEAYAMLCRHYPRAAATVRPFVDWVNATDVHRVEEIFSRTFHVQAICYLDLGFVLFGEDYKRGEFLVNMKREQAAAGNPCGEELADNLANVLTLLPLLKDDAFRAELAGRVLMPALRRMLAEFSPRKTELRTKMLRRKHKALIMDGQADINVYHAALSALFHMLEEDFTEVGLGDYRPQGIDPLYAAAPASDCNTCSIPHSPLIKTAKP